MIFIGIDPDLKKSGVAIMEDGVYKEIIALSFPQLIELIRETRDSGDEVMFVVEDVNKVKPTFYRGQMSQAAKNKISQNVGMVKAVGQLILDILFFYKVAFVLVSPLQGTLKKCKTDKALFKKLTGWEGTTNEDKRDAAMLIYQYKKG